MTSPQQHMRGAPVKTQPTQMPSSSNTSPRAFMNTSNGVPNSDLIPAYVSGIVVVSVLGLFLLNKANFRMIVGVGG